MIYLYDRIVDSETRELEYLGITYQLTGKNHMGKIDYFSYSCAGAEPILVTPAFALQFLEAAKKVKKLKTVTSPKGVQVRLKELFRREPDVESYDYGDSKIYHFAIDYKNIRITMEMENKHLALEPSFTIVSGTLLGNYISVDVSENEELMSYCG